MSLQLEPKEAYGNSYNHWLLILEEYMKVLHLVQFFQKHGPIQLM